MPGQFLPVREESCSASSGIEAAQLEREKKKYYFLPIDWQRLSGA
jgi:hypothetical protein